MSTIVTTPVDPLSRDIDVHIAISRPTQEIATDMTLAVFCTDTATALPPNNGRVVVGSSADAINNALGWTANDTGWWAVNAWAQQSPTPSRFAVGRVVTEAIPTQLMAAAITDYAALNAVADGSFTVTVHDGAGTPAILSVEGIDLSGVASTQSAVSAINAAILAAGQESAVAAEHLYGRIVLTDRLGNASIGFAEPGGSGTDAAALLGLTQEAGAQKWDAYAPAGLASEVNLIRQALRAAGAPPFVIALDRKYRDTIEQTQVADYCEANAFKLAGTFCTNSPTAYDSADAANIGHYCRSNGYRSCSTVYSSHAQQYPEIAYVMSLLSINYAHESKTAKFKGSGITPENITETQCQVLNSRNINVFTRTGNNADYFREGRQGAATWFSDSYYGWANCKEDAQAAVLNGLLRRPKTPLDRGGQSDVVTDLGAVFAKYEDNGFLADREEYDYTLNNPAVIRKAFTIVPSAIWLSDRETRELAPIAVVAYEAGAIHKAAIAVGAYN